MRLYINYKTLETYTAVRISGRPHTLCTYRLGDGTIIEHHYDDGAEALAIKVLEHYRKGVGECKKRISGRGKHRTR